MCNNENIYIDKIKELEEQVAKLKARIFIFEELDRTKSAKINSLEQRLGNVVNRKGI